VNPFLERVVQASARRGRQAALVCRRNGCAAATRFVRDSVRRHPGATVRLGPDTMSPVSRPRRLRVLCPWGATGGPEALHQLVHVARGLGVDARIVYVPSNDVVPEPYRIYDVEPVPSFEDRDDVVLVVPEMFAQDLLGFRQVVPVLWWLSWDYGLTNLDALNQRDIVHASQSHYAFDMLRRRLRRPRQLTMLSDFTREEFLTADRPLRRQDAAAFFPRKSGELGEQLVAANPDIDFVRIESMTPQQVKETLRRVKVYVDLGQHPGKDRVPREAAVSGCCVITSSDRGASQYFEDIPIPRQYKFSTSDFSARHVGDAIRDCMLEYDRRSHDFALYRAVICGERLTFEEEVYRLMRELGCLATTG